MAAGSKAQRSACQASTFSTAVTTAAGKGMEVKSPMTETPNVSLLKPPAWAPSTAPVRLPMRPS